MTTESIERLLGRIEEKLDTLVISNGKQENRTDNQDRRINGIEKTQARIIWTGSGAAGVIALVWTVLTTLAKSH